MALGTVFSVPDFYCCFIMRSGAIPFESDLAELLTKARWRVGGRISDVSLDLPLASIAVSLKARERNIARELLVRPKDRCVLTARECGDDCISRDLSSLQDVRRTLVDKKVERSDGPDDPLYLLIDAMLIGILQFLTYEEFLTCSTYARPHPRSRGFHPTSDTTQAYFDELAVLRGHLSRHFGEICECGAHQTNVSRSIGIGQDQSRYPYS
jgi:hypothetical protein